MARRILLSLFFLSLAILATKCTLEKRHYRDGFYVHKPSAEHKTNAVALRNQRSLNSEIKPGPHANYCHSADTIVECGDTIITYDNRIIVCHITSIEDKVIYYQRCPIKSTATFYVDMSVIKLYKQYKQPAVILRKDLMPKEEPKPDKKKTTKNRRTDPRKNQADKTTETPPAKPTVERRTYLGSWLSFLVGIISIFLGLTSVTVFIWALSGLAVFFGIVSVIRAIKRNRNPSSFYFGLFGALSFYGVLAVFLSQLSGDFFGMEMSILAPYFIFVAASLIIPIIIYHKKRRAEKKKLL